MAMSDTNLPKNNFLQQMSRIFTSQFVFHCSAKHSGVFCTVSSISFCEDKRVTSLRLFESWLSIPSWSSLPTLLCMIMAYPPSTPNDSWASQTFTSAPARDAAPGTPFWFPDISDQRCIMTASIGADKNLDFLICPTRRGSLKNLAGTSCWT